MPPFFVKCDYVKGVCVISGGCLKYKMPSDVVSLLASNGLGVSVLAGIISGVCYVLAHGFVTGKRTRRKTQKWYCEICGNYFHSTVNILNDDLVACFQCGAKVCTAKCSKLLQHARWICNNCASPSEFRIQDILKTVQSNIPGLCGSFSNVMNTTPHPSPEEDVLRNLENEEVRNFIEKLLNVMVGKNVDQAGVPMLYNDKHYLPATGQTSCTAHAALKTIIQNVLDEAVNHSLLKKVDVHPPTQEDANDKTYEGLLATAIINKVITRCQNNSASSSIDGRSNPLAASSSSKDDREYFFGEETLDSKWKTNDVDSSSVSSLDEWLQSESSFGSKKYVDKVTLMIKQNIEEGDDFDSENEEDDAEYFRSSSSLYNDSESNWLLQKRQFQGTHSPVPVPMLVPDPLSDAKVLIGEKPLDDTSDLSDVGSDYEDLVQPRTAHTAMLQSKNIIGGGKSSLSVDQNVDEQSESSVDSGIKEVYGKERNCNNIAEASKPDEPVDGGDMDSFMSEYSNTEKEAEYTEKYASLPRIVKSSRPKESFGSDYYARLAGKPSGGGRKLLQSEVSLVKHINRLEELSTYSTLPRILSSKHSSSNFAENPLRYFPESKSST